MLRPEPPAGVRGRLRLLGKAIAMGNPAAVTVGGVTYDVTPEYLAAASADTTNTAALIEEQLADLKRYVESLEAHWGGIAHDRFRMLMHDYDRCAQLLNRALTGIAGGLQGNYVNYTGAETTNVGGIDKLHAGLPTPTADLT
jgi:WXG100 family type VII secretion target